MNITKLTMPSFNTIITNTLILVIRVYQYTLSPDHGMVKLFFPGGACRYSPTCSQYAIDSVRAFGVLRGGFASLLRVLRCHPFARGGHDPVRATKKYGKCSTIHSVNIITQ